MDLGIAGRTALLTASSRGLGKACAMALAAEGVNVTINGLDQSNLDATAAEIEALGVSVTAVAADINTHEGRATLLEACPDPDILVNNNWGPPPGDWLSFEYEDWLKAVESNMLAPDHDDQGGGAGHAGTQVRPHRQHHQPDGEVAVLGDGSVGGSPLGSHRRLQGVVA